MIEKKLMLASKRKICYDNKNVCTEVSRTVKEKKKPSEKRNHKVKTPLNINSRTSGEKKPNETWLKTKVVFQKIGRVCSIIGKVIFHMRKIFLTLPVLWAAFKVCAYAKEMLPENVGVWLLESGDYQFMLGREASLLSCLAVTAVCLGLMFLSRRTILPWVVSLFTLVLPIMLVLTNMYPA